MAQPIPSWAAMRSTMLKKPSLEDVMDGGDGPTILAALGNGSNNTRTSETIAQMNPPPSVGAMGTTNPSALPTPAQNSSQDQTKDGTTSTRAHYENPAEYGQKVAELAKLPQFASQAKSIQDFKDMINMQMATPTQTDLSGLMGMADLANNGKTQLQGNYRAPQSAAEKLKAIMPLMDKAQDNSRDYNKTLLEAAKSLKDGADVSVRQNTSTDKSTEGGKMATPRDALSWNNSLEKTIGATRQAASGAAEALQMLRSNTPVADKEFKPGFLRALGLMRITNQELNNTSGGKSMSDRLDQMISDADTGKITDTNRGQYIKIMQDISKNIGAAHGEAMERFRLSGKNLARISPDIVDTQIGAASKIHALDAMDMSPYKAGAHSASGTSASADIHPDFVGKTPEQIDAILKSKGL